MKNNLVGFMFLLFAVVVLVYGYLNVARGGVYIMIIGIFIGIFGLGFFKGVNL